MAAETVGAGDASFTQSAEKPKTFFSVSRSAVAEFCRPCGERIRSESHFQSRKHIKNSQIQQIKEKILSSETAAIPGLKLIISSESDKSISSIKDAEDRRLTTVKVDSDKAKKKDSSLTLKLRITKEEGSTDVFRFKAAQFLGKVGSTTQSGTKGIFWIHSLEKEEENDVGVFSMTAGLPLGQPGVYRNPVEVEVTKMMEDGEEWETRKMCRIMEFAVFSKVEQKLGPKAPFVPKKWQFSKAVPMSFREQRNIVRGDPSQLFPTDGRNQLEELMPLPPFQVSLSLRQLAGRNFKLPSLEVEAERERETEPGKQSPRKIRPPVRSEEERVKKLLESELGPANYSERFKLLMHLEELQQEVSIREYDMEGVKMKRIRMRNGFHAYELKVAGLAESRPSVLRGDRVYVWIQNGHGDTQFEGYVVEVEEEAVLIAFPVQFKSSFRNKTEWGVRFTFNRRPLKMMQRAVKMSQELSLNPLLFPVKTNKNLEDGDRVLKLDLYDHKLADNPEQREAVERVVRGVYSPAPYIIFGPPGTGKTVTVVESMKQILKLESRARILACASSNAASDLICQRLLKNVEKSQILRLNAMSRSPMSCLEDILKVSNWSSYHGGFYFPSSNVLAKYRIIITTTTTAGRLASAKFAPGFFTHVFIDEAGQATEPESLTAIAGLVDLHMTGQSRKNRQGHVVLAGDPKQLGPVLHSIMAQQNGLGLSFLERLMTQTELYEKQSNGQYDRRFLTKLVRNYRSHPEILSIPSRMFYEGELVACADKKRRESLAHWKELPTKGIPMVFHGVVGEDMREGNSPSFFNPAEVAIVKNYIDKMMEGGLVKDSDIGIIAPYRKQVEKVRELLKSDLKKYGAISVGSVEEFQGAERRVIIITTVRSNPDFFAIDSEFKLGFLANPKRFNTAITRGKALLIMVGNPWVLQRDPCWKKMLAYCVEKGAYKGIGYSMEGDTDSSEEEEGENRE